MSASLYFVGFVLRLFGVRKTAALLQFFTRTRPKPPNPNEVVDSVERQLQSIIPNEPFVFNRCLTNALTLCWYLASAGLECKVVIGVRTKTGFGAHAWAEYKGRPLLDGQEVLDYYSPIHFYSFGSQVSLS